MKEGKDREKERREVEGGEAEKGGGRMGSEGRR